MATYRWVGSGTTASTSPEIFNWNNASNWRLLVTNGTNKYFIGTTGCPGGNDTVIFGSAYAIAGMTNVEYTKSPCLFGGFVGSAAGGTWAGAAAPYGTTFTSGLQDFYLDNDNIDIAYGNFNLPFTYGRSNSQIALSFTEMPLGGGLSGNISCLNNLLWVANNYPSMGFGVSISATAGTYTFTVPAGYTSSWDNLTIKVKDKIKIYNHGMWKLTGPVNLKVVPTYTPITYSSATGPIFVPTTVDAIYGKDFTLSGGAFKNMDFASVMKVDVSDLIPSLPTLTLTGTIHAEKITIPTKGVKVLDTDVRFKLLNCQPRHSRSDYLGGGTTEVALNNPDRTFIYGSGSVAQVNNVIYPGNTANTSNEQSTVYFTLYAIDSVGVTGIAGSVLGKASARDWALLSEAHENYHMSLYSGGTTESEQYFDALPMGSSPVVAYGQNPYTQELILGMAGVTATTDIGRVAIHKIVERGQEHDYQIPVLKFAGPTNVNTVYIGSYAMMACKDSSASVNIGEVKLGCSSLLDLRGCDNNFNFGLRSSGGTTGGIMAMNEEERIAYKGDQPNAEIGGMPMGKIVFPGADSAGDIRLFNVNTKKSGGLQVTETTVAEVAQVSGTNKKG
jgi:hypothetical protein